MWLMTGATGTVGREVVTQLSAQGIEVRAVTRDLRHVDAHRLPHVPCVHGDFEDFESMHRAFLLTHSTEHAEAQQTAFTRAAHQSGVRHLVELSQFAGRRARVRHRVPTRLARDGAAAGQADQAGRARATNPRPRKAQRP